MLYTAILIVVFTATGGTQHIPIQGNSATEANESCMNLKAQYDAAGKKTLPMGPFNHYVRSHCMLATEPSPPCLRPSPGPAGVRFCTREEYEEHRRGG
jgi:hypothetical protein